jgi:hypothetical protein
LAGGTSSFAALALAALAALAPSLVTSLLRLELVVGSFARRARVERPAVVFTVRRAAAEASPSSAKRGPPSQIAPKVQKARTAAKNRA